MKVHSMESRDKVPEFENSEIKQELKDDVITEVDV
jgi:hypothetical protein